MTRVQSTFDAVSPTLTMLNAPGRVALGASIEALASAIDARAPAKDIDAGVDAVAEALDAVLPAPVPSGE
jgi:hypothetical protein